MQVRYHCAMQPQALLGYQCNVYDWHWQGFQSSFRLAIFNEITSLSSAISNQSKCLARLEIALPSKIAESVPIFENAELHCFKELNLAPTLHR